MKIENKRLPEIDKQFIIQLLNDPRVKKHMPLAENIFDEKEYAKFITAKEAIWMEHGYGPWAYLIDGNFIGWGGLQPEGEDVEIALVLHPTYWGCGYLILKEIIQFSFEIVKLKSVVILLPVSRVRMKGILRIGFRKEVEVEIQGKHFVRYRLNGLEV